MRPLLLGQPDLAGEGVQVGDERLEDLAGARIGRLSKLARTWSVTRRSRSPPCWTASRRCMPFSPRWPSWTVVAACTPAGIRQFDYRRACHRIRVWICGRSAVPDRRRGGLDHPRGAAAAHVPAAAVGAAAGARARARRGAAGPARARGGADRGRPRAGRARAAAALGRRLDRRGRALRRAGHARAPERDGGRDRGAVVARRPAGLDARERARRRGHGRGRRRRRGARRRRPRRHRHRADPPRPRRPRGRARGERQAAGRPARAGDRGRRPRAAGRRAGGGTPGRLGTRRSRGAARRRPDRPGAGQRPGLHEHVVAAWRSVDGDPDRVHEAGTTTTALALVQGGAGVAIMPRALAAVAWRGLVAVPLRQHRPAVETAVVWRPSATSPVLRRFLRLALSTPEPDVLGPERARRGRSILGRPSGSTDRRLPPRASCARAGPRRCDRR